MGRRLILGDIHGELEYLNQVFARSNFDFENDLLIQIGDVLDRGPHPFECIDMLMKVKNRVFIIGNHDHAFLELIASGESILGAGNGVEVTVREWNLRDREEQFNYLDGFFREQKSYHITEDNICFVHGGFDRFRPIKDQSLIQLCWDRELVEEVMKTKATGTIVTVDQFKEVFIGHTPTIYYDKIIPITRVGVTNIDTGSGKGGPLTIMDIDTKEYWQSDLNEKDKLKLQAYGILKKDENNSSEAKGES